jgi:hypothetical protein
LVFDALNQSIYDAALLPSNFRHLLPPSRNFVKLTLDNLDLEGLQEAVDLEPDADAERKIEIIIAYLEDKMPLVSPLIEQFARKHLELSHLVNRTDSYDSNTGVSIEQDEHSGHARLVVEHESLPGVPDRPGIECMRYLVALDAISFLIPEASGTARIECSIGIWHSLLANDEDVVEEDEVAELDNLERASQILLGQAGLNLSTTCFLEWGGKLRLQGKVEANVLGGTEEFVEDIDITRDVGLFRGDDETVTGQFTPLEDPENPESGKFTIHYRLQQLPYAQAYDWVRVTFNRVDISVVPMSQFPRVSLLIQAFVNRDQGEDGDSMVPFRSDLFDRVPPNITLTDWTYNVVYPEDDVGSELSLELHAILINPVNGQEIRRLETRRVIPRFSNEQLEAVEGDTLVEAAANGAVAEWGIPVGLAATSLVMTDDAEQLRVTLTLRNERFEPFEVPPEFQGKTFDIEFPSVYVENDTDHGLSGEAELMFTFHVDVVANEQSTRVYSDETRILVGDFDEVELELTGPPGKRGVVARPGDELVLEVSGIDFDWPPFDPHDRLGAATLRVTVPEGDELDHRNVGLLTAWSHLTRDRDVQNFEARMRITTTSPPPAPRLFFPGVDLDVPEQQVAAGATVTLEYAGLVEWATSGRLARSTDDGQTWREEAQLNTDDPAGTFDVTVDQTTQYRLEVSNVAGTNFSRVLTVRVP